MRPDYIKNGTIFENTHGQILVVDSVTNDREVKARFLAGKEDKTNNFDYFSLDSEYAQECKVLFVPESQPETAKQPESDLILPSYYATETPYEPFKIADFFKMSIRIFSAFKYLIRDKDKSKRIEDLKKAITCIHKEIIHLESLQNQGN